MRRRLLPCALALALALALGSGCADRPAHRDEPGGNGGQLEVSSVAVRGHRDAVLTDDAAGGDTADDDGPDGKALTAVFIGSERPLGLCLAAPPSVDTSSWTARLWLESDQLESDRLEGDPQARGPFEGPAARLAATLCFDAELDFPPQRQPDRLCGELVDSFDGRGLELGCRPVVLEPDEAEYQSRLEGMRSVLASAGDSTTAELTTALDALGAEARQAGSLFLPLRFELVTVYFLRRDGSEAALAAARRRLSELPSWLSDRIASLWAAQAAQDQAVLAMVAPARLRDAWEHLATAERAYRTMAHRKWFTVSMQRAELLARLGATREAVSELRAGLEHCDRAPCEEALLPAARGSLAWMILLDPEASLEALELAGGLIEKSAGEMAGSGGAAIEVANQQINLAYQAVRMGRSPMSRLAAARTELAAAPERRRARQLTDWADLIEADHALATGSATRAQALCAGVASESAEPRLVARATGCRGRSERAAGDLAAAAATFDLALDLHEERAEREFDRSLPLGPGQRAEDFFAAARLEIDRLKPESAWSVLERLDAVAVRESFQQLCGDGGESEGDWTRRRRHLEAELAALEGPASGARREQREMIRRSLQSELQDSLRRGPDCVPATQMEADDRVDFRAFALADEVVLLARDGEGQVRLERRTALPRGELLRRLTAADEALADRQLGDAAWRQLLAPIAGALLPVAVDDLPEVSRFALHGALQRVPLAALPVEGVGGRWLADHTAVALRPVALSAQRASPVDPEVGKVVFAVDPARNLPSGRRLAEAYRRYFPHGEVLAGDRATAAAVRSALGDARMLHIDAHARYDPAFPELSTLELADGRLGLYDLRLPVALELANLSGCRTGSWPTTAASGRYGLAGWLASGGTDWVVGSRADLADRSAERFNEAFYRELAGGSRPPAAYRSALSELRATVPASEWAALMLLDGSAGQTPALTTPVGVEGALRASEEMDHG